MGKNLIQQRRGRGTPRYKAPSHRYQFEMIYPNYSDEALTGEIVDIVHDQARSSPVAIVKLNNTELFCIPAPENVKVGEVVTCGGEAPIKSGNIMTLVSIPEGTSIYNIEKLPKGNVTGFCRTAGSSAKIISRTKEYVLVQLPSKKQKKFNPLCRAVIGVIAGSGRLEKPIVKAGKHHHMMKAKNKLYPIVSGVAMNAVDHPFGSGRGRHMGKPATAPRNAPPGRKVGLIRARRTGMKR
ncbi:50S ribosomal protein L2 [Candidatus Woesearchaeota archaeon]|nr:50S ribosomal protein L2 [Candidatus Woesearchaeota archaeon]